MYKEGINQTLGSKQSYSGPDAAYDGPSNHLPELHITIEARLRKINDSNRYNIERLENIIGRLTSFPENNSNLSGMTKGRMLDCLTDIADSHSDRLTHLCNILEDLV